MANVTVPEEVLTVYEFQRLVFTQALELGWPGREPLMLGNPEADKAFQYAFRFLKSLEGNAAMGNTVQRFAAQDSSAVC